MILKNVEKINVINKYIFLYFKVLKFLQTYITIIILVFKKFILYYDKVIYLGFQIFQKAFLLEIQINVKTNPLLHLQKNFIIMILLKYHLCFRQINTLFLLFYYNLKKYVLILHLFIILFICQKFHNLLLILAQVKKTFRVLPLHQLRLILIPRYFQRLNNIQLKLFYLPLIQKMAH